MNLRTNLLISFLLCQVFCGLKSFAQYSSSMSIDLELTDGLGPKGSFFQSISKIDNLDSTIRLLLPIYKFQGEELADATEYIFMVDKFQFLFQNYVTGKLPKLSFLKEVSRNNWNIKDTIALSKDPMNVVIRVLIGKNTNGKEIYILDGNQDGSFGDDVARPFANWSAISNKIAESSPVKLDFLAGGKVVTKDIPIVLGKDPTVYTIAAQCFWFARFVYKGFPFIVSRDVLANDMVIIPDKPYFERAGSKLFKKNGANINLLGDSFNLTMSKTAATIFMHTTRNLDPTHFVAQPVSLKLVGETIDTVKLIKPLKGKDIITQNLNNTSNLKGKYVLLYFWSDKCRPCINSLPVLNQVYKKLKGREFEIFGVIDIRDKGNVTDFLKKHQVEWPNIEFNSDEVKASGLDVYSYPTTYLLNPEGVIEEMRFDVQSLEYLLENRLQNRIH